LVRWRAATIIVGTFTANRERVMPRKRKAETQEDRDKRLKEIEVKLHDADRAEEGSLDAMVQKSIKFHGP
jgi:hypothetical protein